MKQSLIALSVVSAIFAFPLLAQPLGSNYRASTKDHNEIREVSREYADCVVAKKPEMAREAILSNASNEVIAKKYKRLINGSCLVKATDGDGGKMSFGGDHFRYSIAGALVRLDLKNFTPENFEDTPMLVHADEVNPDPKKMARTDRKGEKYREAIASIKAKRALSIYGECIVRSDAENSYALVISEIGSQQETTSFAKLQPSFGPCLNSEGEFRFTRSILRGLVNVNFYRLAMAKRAQQTSVVKTAQPELMEAAN